MIARRVVPLALAVTALLAVVAIAAHGRPLGGSAAHGNGLPVSFWDYVYTSIVIVAVPVLVAVLAAAVLARPRSTKRPTFARRLLDALTLILLIALAVVVLRYLSLSRLHVHPQTPAGQAGPVNPAQNRRPDAGTHTLRFQWGELAVVLGLLLVVAAGAVVVARRSRPEPRMPLERAPEALAAALDESLDDLRTDPDLRRAIVAAYARMETALAAAGLPRRAAEAPLEYLERALVTLETSAEAVRRLTDLFEWARFSQHEPEPSMRDDAVDALVAVRDELRASELTPA
jgi:Domain of unknown function (DUF4129)